MEIQPISIYPFPREETYRYPCTNLQMPSSGQNVHNLCVSWRPPQCVIFPWAAFLVEQISSASVRASFRFIE